MNKRIAAFFIMALACVTVILSCDNKKNITPVNGVLDETVVSKAPETVKNTLKRIIIDDRFENILNDEKNGISVWCLMRCDDNNSSEGYGVVVRKGNLLTAFPDIRHGNNPKARYDSSSKRLFLTGGAVEGTGILAEQLHIIGFDETGKATILTKINPYDIQKALCGKLGHTVNDSLVTFYDGTKKICAVVDTTTDMGGLDSTPVWIGEQIAYDISGRQPRVLVIPSLKHVTGLVLDYSMMPTIEAEISIGDGNKIAISDLKVFKDRFEGTYFDMDNHEPNLTITYRRDDGRYDVQIGIFRLTTLDDGIATENNGKLNFTATDAAGNPIGGVIDIKSDTATVTFTKSTWPLLENGSSFQYSLK